MKHAPLFLVFLLPFAGACRAGEGGDSAATKASVASDAVRVTGTLLDAATGASVPNVTVVGPRGTRSRSDAHGRFTLTGLSAGDAGEVVAEAGDGRRASVVLRPLAGGTLEVVLHLAAPVARD
jgi:hypothetical protein